VPTGIICRYPEQRDDIYWWSSGMIRDIGNGPMQSGEKANGENEEIVVVKVRPAIQIHLYLDDAGGPADVKFLSSRVKNDM
jgi:hypothetical protein